MKVKTDYRSISDAHVAMAITASKQGETKLASILWGLSEKYYSKIKGD